MKLFHYTTWMGNQMYQERVIKPDNRYARFVFQTILSEWPRLTFLTQNEEWEPSVQAYSEERFWEKCCSHPETYAALNIPCWKFEVNPNGLILGVATDFKGCANWKKMLDDARKLGSTVEDWRIAVQDAYIINSWKWENDEWLKLSN